MMNTKSWVVVILTAFTTSIVPAALGQTRDWDAIEVKAHQVTANFYYLEGSGGNIGLLIGDDGIIMIDDQFAPLSEKIIAAIRGVSDKPIRFLITRTYMGITRGATRTSARWAYPY